MGSDHGVRVWGNLFRHIDLTAEIPLILRIPDKSPAILDADVQLADLAPTLLDILDCSYSSGDFDGVTIFANHRPVRNKTIHLLPAALTYSYNEPEGEWLPDSGIRTELNFAGKKSSMSMLDSKFSAVHAIDDVLLARKSRQDFLTLYLARHFPKSLSSSDLQDLRSKIESQETSPDAPGNNFQTGMFLFFLALSETRFIAEGQKLDQGEVNSHWRSALSHLRKTGDLQPWMAEEVEKLIDFSDVDNDERLSLQELAAMIQRRQLERYD